jgi:hypothetical protein
MAARVQHAHAHGRETHEQEIGKHHAQQAQHQDRARLVEADDAERERDAEHAREHDDGRGDQQAGDDGIGRVPHGLLALGFFLLLEDGDEGGGERAFAEQAAEEVGNLEGQRERARDPARAHEVRIDDFPHQPEHAAQHGGGGGGAGGF